ncbi:hypothetical protein ACS0TY_017235 [Phlomoides rotata]
MRHKSVIRDSIWGLFEALRWARDMGFEKVVVEFDAKRVFDALHKERIDISTFGDYINLCNDLLAHNVLFDIKLVRRNVNDVAHYLARASVSYDSPCLWVEPPNFVDGLLDNTCFCNE